jgi:hypothetical protein
MALVAMIVSLASSDDDASAPAPGEGFVWVLSIEGGMKDTHLRTARSLRLVHTWSTVHREIVI